MTEESSHFAPLAVIGHRKQDNELKSWGLLSCPQGVRVSTVIYEKQWMEIGMPPSKNRSLVPLRTGSWCWLPMTKLMIPCVPWSKVPILLKVIVISKDHQGKHLPAQEWSLARVLSFRSPEGKELELGISGFLCQPWPHSGQPRPAGPDGGVYLKETFSHSSTGRDRITSGGNGEDLQVTNNLTLLLYNYI